MTDNLSLWNSVETTPPSQVKEITGKSYRGNSPKPHYLVHKATETFGPCGIGWGFAIVDERIEDGAGGERMHIARVRVWYDWNGKRGEVEHIGGTQFSGTRASGKPFTDEDAPKKSVTDALVKALSMIGFAGDIFMGRYDDSKYVADLRQDERAASQKQDNDPAHGDRRTKHVRDYQDGEDKREEALSKDKARPVFSTLQDDLRRNKSKADLRRWWDDPDVKELRSQIPDDWKKELKKAVADLAETLPEELRPEDQPSMMAG